AAMTVRQRITDGLYTVCVLAVVGSVIGSGLYRSDSPDGPMPGESRVSHHIRTCPDCDIEGAISCHLGCPGMSAVLREIRKQAGNDRPCRACLQAPQAGNGPPGFVLPR